MFLGVAALTALHIGVPGPTHILEEIVLQHAVRFFKDRLTLRRFQRFAGDFIQNRLGRPFLAHTDLHDCFFYLANQRLVLAPFGPADLLLHHRHIDHMEVVVVHILPQCLGHSPVALVGVHDCRQNVLFTAHDFDCSLIGVVVKLFCEVISAVVEKVGGVYIEDQLTVAESVLFDAPCGDDSVSLHLFKLFQIAAVRFLEVNIQMGAFRDYILVDIRFFFTLVVLLRVFQFGCGQSHISCAGTMDTVASCHRTPFSPHKGAVEMRVALGNALLRKCNNPL